MPGEKEVNVIIRPAAAEDADDAAEMVGELLHEIMHVLPGFTDQIFIIRIRQYLSFQTSVS